MQRHSIIVAILALLSANIQPMSKAPSYWQKISLPNIFVAPATNSLTINGKPQTFTYSFKNEGTPTEASVRVANAESFIIPFPTTKLEWYWEEKTCRKTENDFAGTQTRVRSDYLSRFYGLSFLGSIQNKEIGKSTENHFSIFFHIEQCYKGGPEVGFAFYENGKCAIVYECHNCNLNSQQWWDWPGINGREIGNENVNDPGNMVSTALSTPSQERYYNIQVTQAGDFVVQVINPNTWQKLECTIKKPTWFPNLYGKGGYITVNAKRSDNSTAKMGTLHLKEVKVYQ